MYERFTDRALKIMQLANQEAQRMGHECIGTEPILLGLVRVGSGTATRVLKGLHVDLRDVGPAVKELAIAGTGESSGKLPLAPGAKRTIEYAMAAARQMNHEYIGSEHILLGLLHEQDGVAPRALEKLGVTLDMAMAEIVKISGQ